MRRTATEQACWVLIQELCAARRHPSTHHQALDLVEIQRRAAPVRVSIRSLQRAAQIALAQGILERRRTSTKRGRKTFPTYKYEIRYTGPTG